MFERYALVGFESGLFLVRLPAFVGEPLVVVEDGQCLDELAAGLTQGGTAVHPERILG